MQTLKEKLEKYSINDAINIESSDLQFIALKEMYNNLKNKDLYLAMILVNSLICYQLSSSWEKYWTEFGKKCGEYLNENKFLGDNFDYIYNFFDDFLPNSKWNKRFVSVKLKRIEKLKDFLENFLWNEVFYYENMINFRDNLAKVMNQKITAKTIVFSVKMFSYWARIHLDKIVYFPKEISIPIDSRITNLYEKYILREENKEEKIENFYNRLSEETKIPPLHLDGILWVNYEEFMKD